MIHEERGAPLPERPLESVCRQGGLRPHGLDTTLETYGGGVPGGDRRAEIPWRTTIAPGRTDMGSALPKAKTRPVSWNALEKREPFTQDVKAQLEILKSRRRAKVFPNDALSGKMLDKVIMSIGCVCYPYCSIKPIGASALDLGCLAAVWRGSTDIAADDGRDRWSGVGAWWGWRWA